MVNIISITFNPNHFAIKANLKISLNNDTVNPNSKTENYTCIQTSFCNVNTSNTSSGLRENVILTNLASKFGGKNMVPKCRMGNEGEGRHPWEGHVYHRGGISANCKRGEEEAPLDVILTPVKNIVNIEEYYVEGWHRGGCWYDWNAVYCKWRAGMS